MLLPKLLLLSVIIASVVIPVLAARDPNPRRSLRKAVFFMIVFNVLYLLAIRFVYPRLL